MKYDFTCRSHGPFQVAAPMRDGPGEHCPCPACGRPGRRDWQVSRAIVRPPGWNLRPGERRRDVPGLSYSNFSHELARGYLTDDATSVYTPESRARREAELAAEDERPRTMAEIDRDIPERAHRELHEWGRAVYSELEETRSR